VPSLATEVPTVENGGISRDGLRYTFKLRKGVKWHDGKSPLADVAFTYQAVMNPAVDVRGRAGGTRSPLSRRRTTPPSCFASTIDARPSSTAWPRSILPRHILGEAGVDIKTHKWFRRRWVWGPSCSRRCRESHRAREEPELPGSPAGRT
jgi:ABC-type transport system substrate-binding protein